MAKKNAETAVAEADELLDDIPVETKPKRGRKKAEAAVVEEVEEVAEAKPKRGRKKAAEVAEELEVEEAPKKRRAPISFSEGERDQLAEQVTAHFKRNKKPINSRDLATKLGTETRKLRLVLYTLQRREAVLLTPGESKVAGMTVSPG